MTKRLPLLADMSVSEARAARLLKASEYESKVHGNVTPTCRAGCDHCCYYPVSVTILEGISLYQWLSKQHLWTPKLKAKFQEHKAVTFDLAPEVWLLSLIPCPLLHESKCTAYEARPFLCRTVFSVDDPHYCHPHRLGDQRAGILNRTEEVDAIWKAEAKILKKHRLRSVMLPLSTAVLLAERIVKGEIEIEEANSTLLEEYQA